MDQKVWQAVSHFHIVVMRTCWGDFIHRSRISLPLSWASDLNCWWNHIVNRACMLSVFGEISLMLCKAWSSPNCGPFIPLWILSIIFCYSKRWAEASGMYQSKQFTTYFVHIRCLKRIHKSASGVCLQVITFSHLRKLSMWPPHHRYSSASWPTAHL